MPSKSLVRLRAGKFYVEREEDAKLLEVADAEQSMLAVLALLVRLARTGAVTPAGA